MLGENPSFLEKGRVFPQTPFPKESRLANNCAPSLKGSDGAIFYCGNESISRPGTSFPAG